MLGDLSFDNLRTLHVASCGIRAKNSPNSKAQDSDGNLPQDEDKGLTTIWRAIKEHRTSTLEQQLTEIVGQLRELLRGSVQRN